MSDKPNIIRKVKDEIWSYVQLAVANSELEPPPESQCFEGYRRNNNRELYS